MIVLLLGLDHPMTKAQMSLTSVILSLCPNKLRKLFHSLKVVTIVIGKIVDLELNILGRIHLVVLTKISCSNQQVISSQTTIILKLELPVLVLEHNSLSRRSCWSFKPEIICNVSRKTETRCQARVHLDRLLVSGFASKIFLIQLTSRS